MKSTVKRIAATAMAAMMALTSTTGAMAAEYYSGSLSIGSRLVRRTATPAPTAEPTPAPEEVTLDETEVLEEVSVSEATVSEATVSEATLSEETLDEAIADEAAAAEETPAPEAETDPEEAPVIDVSKLKVEIFTTQGDAVMLGETITLSCKLTGFEGLTYKVQWQFNDGSGWQDMPEATEETYSFAADEDNVSYSWRLAVSL